MQNPSWISMPCVSSSRSMLSSSSRRVSSSFWSWDVSAHRVIANHAKQCHRRNKTYINPQTDAHQYKLYVNEARTRRRRRRKATTTQGSIRLWGKSNLPSSSSSLESPSSMSSPLLVVQKVRRGRRAACYVECEGRALLVISKVCPSIFLVHASSPKTPPSLSCHVMSMASQLPSVRELPFMACFCYTSKCRSRITPFV